MRGEIGRKQAGMRGTGGEESAESGGERLQGCSCQHGPRRCAANEGERDEGAATHAFPEGDRLETRETRLNIAVCNVNLRKK